MSKHGRVIREHYMNLELKYIPVPNRTEIQYYYLTSNQQRVSINQGLTSLKFRSQCKNVSSTLPITQLGLNNRKKSKGRLKAILFTEDTKPTTLTMAAG